MIGYISPIQWPAFPNRTGWYHQQCQEPSSVLRRSLLASWNQIYLHYYGFGMLTDPTTPLYIYHSVGQSRRHSRTLALLVLKNFSQLKIRAVSVCESPKLLCSLRTCRIRGLFRAVGYPLATSSIHLELIVPPRVLLIDWAATKYPRRHASSC